MKTILMHVHDDDSLEGRFQTALSLTRAAGGHLSCLHVTPVEAYAMFNSFSGVFVMSDILEIINEHATGLQQRIEERLRKEDISWDYVERTGPITNTIVTRAALADAIVTARETDALSPITFFGDLLHRSRTPLIIPPVKGKAYDPTGIALVAWNGSYEAANAVRGALGALKLAQNVVVVRVETKAEKDALFPATELLEYLSRHEIHAKLRAIESVNEGVTATILECAKEIDATLLVIGGYSHGRLGEYVFGGVTRDLLIKSPICLLVAH